MAQPYMPKTGYSFVAAGALRRTVGNLSIHIRYRRSKDEIKLVQKDANHLWVRCPDREIVFTRNAQCSDLFNPAHFDTCLDFNMLNDHVPRAMGINYVMTNYAHSSRSINYRHNITSPPDNERIQMLSDSGGLQLVTQALAANSKNAKNYTIHPKSLINFYNNNVDAGMILDIPLAASDFEVTKRAALLQKANTDIMLDNANSHVELINIFHGVTMKEREMYQSIVETDRINRLALGGLHFNNLITAMSVLYRTTANRRYKQYHVLGVFALPYIVLIIKIANQGDNPPHITSDSTSHIQSAASRIYHHQFDINQISRRMSIGHTENTLLSTRRHLPCQCNVCRAIKHIDLFAFTENRYVRELLSIHNAYEMARYTQQLQEACRSLKPHEYNALVLRQLKGSHDVQLLKQALHFVDYVGDHGLHAAEQKYKVFMDKRRPVNLSNPKTLFGDDSNKSVSSKHKHVSTLIKLMEAQIGL